MDISFNIQERIKCGTGPARFDRRNGFVPAVIYGTNKETLHFNIKMLDLTKIMEKNSIRNKKISLISDKKTAIGMVQDIQYHPVNDRVIHIDFIYI